MTTPATSTPEARPLALDPQYNVRCFFAGDRGCVAAAAGRFGTGFSGRVGALTAIAEGVPPGIAAALRQENGAGGVYACQEDHRLLLTGSLQPLLQLGLQLEQRGVSAGGEIARGVAALSFEEWSGRRPLVMGILNVTPDSFSDGGEWLDPDRAVDRALEMVEQGADVLDIGGESTRPGADEVPAEEELRRVLPVVQRLKAQTRALLSIDTRKAAVAYACLDAGADWINDISGLTFDPDLPTVVARHPDAKLVLMHSRRKPEDDRYSTEYDPEGKPVYDDVVADTLRWLRRQVGVAVAAGITPDRLWIDPGFGFGKTFEQNIELLQRLREFTSTGLPVLIGTSRKSTLGRLLGDTPPDDRLEGSLATAAWSIFQGAAAVRVHDVREASRMVRVLDALR